MTKYLSICRHNKLLHLQLSTHMPCWRWYPLLLCVHYNMCRKLSINIVCVIYFMWNLYKSQWKMIDVQRRHRLRRWKHLQKAQCEYMRRGSTQLNQQKCDIWNNKSNKMLNIIIHRRSYEIGPLSQPQTKIHTHTQWFMKWFYSRVFSTLKWIRARAQSRDGSK